MDFSIFLLWWSAACCPVTASLAGTEKDIMLRTNVILSRINMKFQLSLAVAFVFLVSGCASSGAVAVSGADQSGKPVTNIAVVSDSVLADSVGIGLASKGFIVSPAPSGSNAMSLLQQDKRQELAESGFDGLLVVKSTNDDEGRPQNANAMIYSIDSGRLITGVNWENGHGFGMRGSLTNQAMKVNQHDAAEEIAEELAKVIPR